MLLAAALVEVVALVVVLVVMVIVDGVLVVVVVEDVLILVEEWMVYDLKWKVSAESVFPALQWWVFEHNSFDFENLMMGLDVLESLFYGLQIWCFEFLHRMCRKIVNWS